MAIDEHIKKVSHLLFTFSALAQTTLLTTPSLAKLGK